MSEQPCPMVHDWWRLARPDSQNLSRIRDDVLQYLDHVSRHWKKKLALPQVVRVIIVISSNLTETMFSSYMFARRLTDWWHNYIVNYNVDACSQLRTSHWGMLFSFNGYQNCFSCWIIWKANFLSHGQFITQSGRRQSVLSYVFKFQTILTSQYTFLFTSMHESVTLNGSLKLIIAFR